MKKLMTFFSILFILFGIFSFVSVNANSAVRKIKKIGENGYGVAIVGENTIRVQNENLTFDLYGDSANVTAEYTFYNYSSSDKNVELVFPIGSATSNNTYNPSVYVDSTKLDTKMRFFLHSKNDIVDSLSNLYDDYVETTLDDYNIYYCEINDPSLNSHVVEVTGGYIVSDVNHYFVDDIIDDNINSFYFRDYFYVLAKGEFSVSVDNDNTEYTMRDSTKQELVREHYCKCNHLGVLYDLYEKYPENEMDIYNIYILLQDQDAYGVGDPEDYNIIAAIDYNIDIEGKGTCVNTVETNMIYTVNDKYKSTVYELDYYVSPASTFKAFDHINVTVNTDMYLISNNIKLKQVKKGQYKVSYDELINGDISLALSYDKSIKSVYGGGVLAGLFLGIAIFAFIIYIFGIIADVALLTLGIIALIFGKKKKKLKNNIFLYAQTMSLFLIINISVLIIAIAEYNYKIFMPILLVVPISLGIVQLIFDIKKYKLPAIIIDSVILGILTLSLCLSIIDFRVDFIIIILYLFNLAYLFFKSNFLKNKENIIESNEEIQNDSNDNE